MISTTAMRDAGSPRPAATEERKDAVKFAVHDAAAYVVLATVVSNPTYARGRVDGVGDDPSDGEAETEADRLGERDVETERELVGGGPAERVDVPVGLVDCT